jgi:hypothetical protein
LLRLELIKKQQHARAEAHKASEEAKKSTMAQLEVALRRFCLNWLLGIAETEPLQCSKSELFITLPDFSGVLCIHITI